MGLGAPASLLCLLRASLTSCPRGWEEVRTIGLGQAAVSPPCSPVGCTGSTQACARGLGGSHPDGDTVPHWLVDPSKRSRRKGTGMSRQRLAGGAEPGAAGAVVPAMADGFPETLNLTVGSHHTVHRGFSPLPGPSLCPPSGMASPPAAWHPASTRPPLLLSPAPWSPRYAVLPLGAFPRAGRYNREGGANQEGLDLVSSQESLPRPSVSASVEWEQRGVGSVMWVDRTLAVRRCVGNTTSLLPTWTLGLLVRGRRVLITSPVGGRISLPGGAPPQGRHL